MNFKLFLLLIPVLVVLIAIASRGKSKKNKIEDYLAAGYFKSYPGMWLFGSLNELDEEDGIPLADCAYSCGIDPICKSFNHIPSSGRCSKQTISLEEADPKDNPFLAVAGRNFYNRIK